MAVVLAVLFGVAAVILSVRLYTVERALRGAARQLRKAEKVGSAARILLTAPNSSAEALIAAVNGLLELRCADEADFRSRETALRRQIANISHDLRTPLTSILGYLQLLKGDGLDPAERTEYLTIVEGRAKALQSLITSFYDLSRLDGDEYPLVREQMDLHAILGELMAGFYHDLISSGFAVEVELEEGLPPVWGDPAATLRIFTNLLRNALEHGSGQLSVRLFREGREVVVSFSNGAGGLSDADITPVFDRSFTSDKNRTSHNAGLGLAIVKALAQRMGCGVSASLESGLFTIKIRWKH